jgi:Na+-translocating ferredoxin:NAD+ oxidoreductase subunit E
MTPNLRDLALQGLWKNNPALVQMLGLCPLLAVSSNVAQALGLGLATLMVLTCSNLAISALAAQVPNPIRLPLFVMVIAVFTTCAELLMQAFSYPLYQILGIFIPLIVTNCVILGRAEAFASRQPLLPATLDGFMMGLGFLLALLAIGALRELAGTGVLFADMALLVGPVAAHWKLQILPADYPGFLLAILPPGAFFAAGLLLALKNYIDARLAKRQVQVIQVPLGSKRVRTTGVIR